jgi:G3E family GTPase
MKIIFVTGTLGSGKTTLLINLLRWLRSQNEALPPIIVNDRGSGSNLDYARVTSEVQGVEASDLLGQCIGCAGREEFLTLVCKMQRNGHELLLVEPTGLFSIDELEGINRQLPDSSSVRSVHLIPVTEIQAATAVGFKNMSLCRVIIGLTHVRGEGSVEVNLLAAATGKLVVVVEETPSNDQMEVIWDHLVSDKVVPFIYPGSRKGSRIMNTTHATPACTLACTHGNHHDHHHHHENEAHCTTFSTEGWTMGELLGYLLSLGGNLVRFKGVVEAEDGLVQVEWAHGSWGKHPASMGSLLKADLFTRERIEKPNRIALTDGNIRQLMKGIPPLLIHSSTGGYAKFNPVGTTAWELLYEQSKRASVEVRRECGLQLVQRCREAVTYLQEGDLSPLDPKLLDFYRIQSVMLWLFWNQEFGFMLDRGDREAMDVALAKLDPSSVDQCQLTDWLWEGGPDFKALLMAQWPERVEMWNRLF